MSREGSSASWIKSTEPKGVFQTPGRSLCTAGKRPAGGAAAQTGHLGGLQGSAVAGPDPQRRVPVLWGTQCERRDSAWSFSNHAYYKWNDGSFKLPLHHPVDLLGLQSGQIFRLRPGSELDVLLARRQISDHGTPQDRTVIVKSKRVRRRSCDLIRCPGCA